MATGARVLVVEDDKDSQTLLRKQLTAKGFEVAVVANGLEGLMYLERGSADLILCDVNMPQLDGISFVRAIKARPETRSIPVIFLTASNDPRLMVDGINVGARYYVVKPFDLDELVWKMKRVLSSVAA
jgi:CheY-like chemotaxis protein